ncbi:hypothetical protein [Azorhizophilus paspali]|uniref:hypothetical protein n=1 Tax=Azorhizophilus paspali TaxID=69963 RepID=UPI003636CC43
MTDFQRCQPAATGSACPEKGPALQLTNHHLELIRQARAALHRAIKENPAPEDREAWITAAERLAVALVARLESIEEDRP